MGIYIDILLVSFLICQIWLGWRTGLLWQIATLASIGIGIVLGVALAPDLGVRLLGVVTQNFFHAKLLAFIFVFATVCLLLRLLATYFEVSKKKPGAENEEGARLSKKDKIWGGVFGGLKAVVVSFILLAVGVTLYPSSPLWEKSHLVPQFAEGGARLLPEGAAKEVAIWVEHSVEDIRKGLEIQTSEEKKRKKRSTASAVKKE